MDEIYLLQASSMLLFSLWKTYIGPLIAAGSGFAYWEMLIFNMGAALGSAGATLFITDYWMAKRASAVKGFNKNLRRILRIWNSYGNYVTLVLAPVLLGIPSYAFIARRLKVSRSKIMIGLAVVTFTWCSLIFWAGWQGLLLVGDWV